ncbi:tetratricopeptide repeat protein 1 [Osmerus eperlanus]|uniref:tetratricopeptide repeat protein 1 n=1 Tax=Osmerus eperlanus TaxID=29151 RepID=UPI002E1536DC
MDSSAETDVLQDRVRSSSRISEGQRGAGGGGTGLSRAPDQEEDCFYDCEESLESALGSVDAEARPGSPQDPFSSAEAGGVSQVTETDGQTGTQDPGTGAGALGDGGAGLEGEEFDLEEEEKEEEEKERWDECGGVEGDKMPDGGRDSDSELKEEEITAAEFDEEHLTEVEKDLTEEEKEKRREESLTLKEKGNSQFKNGEHAEAEEWYTSALGVCPVCYSKERAVLFSNRAAARLHLEKNDKAIADCTKAIELKPDYVRALVRRAELHEKTDKLDEALEDYRAALQLEPSQAVARDACLRLPQQIHERNEKLKEEMMSKLKDLGNMFLRPFGLSTSNFQVNQDENTGSYSVNFVQGPNNNNNR